jgi:hypothetical protein
MSSTTDAKQSLKPYSDISKKIVINGKYKHYSGKTYIVLSLARHSETLEELVVYQSNEGEKECWVRPLEMFAGIVTLSGKEVQRFALV